MGVREDQTEHTSGTGVQSWQASLSQSHRVRENHSCAAVDKDGDIGLSHAFAPRRPFLPEPQLDLQAGEPIGGLETLVRGVRLPAHSRLARSATGQGAGHQALLAERTVEVRLPFGEKALRVQPQLPGTREVDAPDYHFLPPGFFVGGDDAPARRDDQAVERVGEGQVGGVLIGASHHHVVIDAAVHAVRRHGEEQRPGESEGASRLGELAIEADEHAQLAPRAIEHGQLVAGCVQQALPADVRLVVATERTVRSEEERGVVEALALALHPAANEMDA